MFNRYTQEATRVIYYGRGEASELGNSVIETDHLLLGLVKDDVGLVKHFFSSPDVVHSIRTRIEQKLKTGSKVPTTVDLPLSLAAQRVLIYANQEAARLKDYHIAPAHILLGLLHDEESVAAEILKEHGIGSEEVQKYLVNNPATVTLPPPAPEAAMVQMITGFWISRAIYTAAKLGIADLVKSDAKTVDELAAATGSDSRSLYRMLRALASVGVFFELEDRKFGTTPLASTLEEGRWGTLRYFAMSELGQEHYSAWEEFPYSVRTGGLAFTEKFKQPVWEYFATHHEHAEVFNRSMSTLTEWVTQSVLFTYDFSPFKKIVDVGGGQGAFLSAMLRQAPAASGVLFDAAAVIAEATRLHDAGMADRAEQVAGNFFESVPEGGDLYTLKMILHDWNDQECATILGNIRKAIASGGKLVIVETVLGDGPDAVFKNFLDLNMMVMTGGCERSEADYRTLLEKAGFKLLRMIPTVSPMGIIEAVAE